MGIVERDHQHAAGPQDTRQLADRLLEIGARVEMIERRSGDDRIHAFRAQRQAPHVADQESDAAVGAARLRAARGGKGHVHAQRRSRREQVEKDAIAPVRLFKRVRLQGAPDGAAARPAPHQFLMHAALLRGHQRIEIPARRRPGADLFPFVRKCCARLCIYRGGRDLRSSHSENSL